MQATKAVLIGVVGVLVLLIAVFGFFPSTRPAMVKSWFRRMGGYAPAQTPTEALEKFRACVKNRDYETAAELYCTKAYRDQVLKGADAAKKLATAIDGLTYQMEQRGVVNPKTKYMLKLLEPFPKSFTVVDVKDRGTTAFARIGDEDPAPPTEAIPPHEFFQKHGNLCGSLLPNYPNEYWSAVEVIKEDGSWKLNIPVTTRLQNSVDALKDRGTNYANAIGLVRDDLRVNADTKAGIQKALEQRLSESE